MEKKEKTDKIREEKPGETEPGMSLFYKWLKYHGPSALSIPIEVLKEDMEKLEKAEKGEE